MSHARDRRRRSERERARDEAMSVGMPVDRRESGERHRRERHVGELGRMERKRKVHVARLTDDIAVLGEPFDFASGEAPGPCRGQCGGGDVDDINGERRCVIE